MRNVILSCVVEPKIAMLWWMLSERHERERERERTLRTNTSGSMYTCCDTDYLRVFVHPSKTPEYVVLRPSDLESVIQCIRTNRILVLHQAGDPLAVGSALQRWLKRTDSSCSALHFRSVFESLCGPEEERTHPLGVLV